MTVKHKIADIVYGILLDGPGKHSGEGLNILSSLSETQTHTLNDETHEVVGVAGKAKPIPIINVLAASIKVEEILIAIYNDQKEPMPDDMIDATWQAVWKQLLDDKRVRIMPSVHRSRFKVVS